MSDLPADWDALWRNTSIDAATVIEEERTPRWHQIEQFVHQRFGSFADLRVLEVGSGHGTNAIHFSRRGAAATLLDTSEEALEGGARTAQLVGTEVDTELGDAFDPPRHLIGEFDISCSFGLCEHFTGPRRQEIIAAHLRFLRPGGVAMIGVPNREAFAYRAWMGFLKKRGHWPLGTEEPFTAAELTRRLRAAGGSIGHVGFGSFPATIVGYLINPFLHNFGRPGLRRPQFTTPFDRFAYELLVIASS